MLLKTYLKRSGLLQHEFAARIGSNQSTVSNWMSGRRMPGALWVSKIQKATGGKVTLADHLSACVKSARRKGKPSGR